MPENYIHIFIYDRTFSISAHVLSEQETTASLLEESTKIIFCTTAYQDIECSVISIVKREESSAEGILETKILEHSHKGAVHIIISEYSWYCLSRIRPECMSWNLLVWVRMSSMCLVIVRYFLFCFKLKGQHIPRSNHHTKIFSISHIMAGRGGGAGALNPSNLVARRSRESQKVDEACVG